MDGVSRHRANADRLFPRGAGVPPAVALLVGQASKSMLVLRLRGGLVHPMQCYSACEPIGFSVVHVTTSAKAKRIAQDSSEPLVAPYRTESEYFSGRCMPEVQDEYKTDPSEQGPFHEQWYFDDTENRFHRYRPLCKKKTAVGAFRTPTAAGSELLAKPARRAERPGVARAVSIVGG